MSKEYRSEPGCTDHMTVSKRERQLIGIEHKEKEGTGRIF